MASSARYAVLPISVGFLVFFALHCGPGLDTHWPGPPSLQPASQYVIELRNRTFTASGGTGPYTYSTSGGGGSFSGGTYTAPGIFGDYGVFVTDATNYVGAAVAHVVPQFSWIGKIAALATAGNSSLTIGDGPGCTSATAGATTPGWCSQGKAGAGANDGQFGLAYGIAISDIYIYAVDNANGKIQRYDRVTGAPSGWVGTVNIAPAGGTAGCSSLTAGQVTPGWCNGGASQAGSVDGALTSPYGIVSQGDYLYAADSGNHRIVRYRASTGEFTGWIGKINFSPTGGDVGCNGASAGTFTLGWCKGGSAQANSNNDGGLNTPVGLAIDSTYLYVADPVRHEVLRYRVDNGAYGGAIGKPSGTACYWCSINVPGLASGDGGLNAPYGVAVSGNWLYVTENANQRVQRFDVNAGTPQGWIGKVGGVATSGGANGCSGLSNALTPGWCTGGTVGTLDSNGGDGGFSGPTGISVESSGNLLVSDDANQRVLKFDPNGVFVGWIGSMLNPPTGGDTGCQTMSQYTITPGWCTGGKAFTGGTHETIMVNAIAESSDGFIYMTDHNTNRVVRYLYY